jgi:pyruvate dehydrogenase E2 component (dihydrolipoamide acetyltransferase)/2-oxoisovalerate dehydrogenase E2 component (dihydrolipoyl transacylase)
MDFQLPELGEGVYEAELIAWKVKPGDRVKRGQTLMEVMTDKATMEVPAPFAGTITGLSAQAGEQLRIGQVVLSYAAAESRKGNGEPPKPEVEPPRPEAAGPRPPLAAARQTRAAPAADSTRAVLTVRAAPSVRLMARKLGIDLTQVRGSGPDGRILIEDLTRVIELPERRPAGEAAAVAELMLDVGKPGTRIKLAGIRRKIAEHLVQSKRTIPHYSYVDECDVSELVRLRAALRETAGRRGIKLTYLAFVVKAAVEALREVPLVNSTLDEQAGEIVLFDRYHIGVAVATPAGLVVPVIHDADQKDLWQVAREIERLSGEARAGKVKLEDLKGGTFTITSVGNIGGLISTPVINHPQVGILGIGKVVKRPVYDAAGQLRPADIIYLSFSFDHRVLDGAVGATFGNALIRRLQNPAALLVPD